MGSQLQPWHLFVAVVGVLVPIFTGGIAATWILSRAISGSKADVVEKISGVSERVAANTADIVNLKEADERLAKALARTQVERVMGAANGRAH